MDNRYNEAAMQAKTEYATARIGNTAPPQPPPSGMSQLTETLIQTSQTMKEALTALRDRVDMLVGYSPEIEKFGLTEVDNENLLSRINELSALSTRLLQQIYRL